MKSENVFTEFLDLLARADCIDLQHQELRKHGMDLVTLSHSDEEICTVFRSRANPVYIENIRCARWKNPLRTGFKVALTPEFPNRQKAKHYGGWSIVTQEGMYWIKGDTVRECFAYVRCWIVGRSVRNNGVGIFPDCRTRKIPLVPDKQFLDELTFELSSRSTLNRISNGTLNSLDGTDSVTVFASPSLTVEINGRPAECECGIDDVGVLAASILGEMDGLGISPDD